ncbi:MAG: AraC family transcriptional regulator [Cyclobacteriaceae bacterium]
MFRIFFVKNMVCDRCKQVVRDELEHLGVSVRSIRLGEVEVINEENLEEDVIAQRLQHRGFELLRNEQDWQIEKIKRTIILFVQESNAAAAQLTFSHYLQQMLCTDYRSVSALFSRMEGVTIERYLILQRMEKVKELLTYDELTMGQIAERMNYRNSAHLSTQFKKETGMTPSQFKKQEGTPRKSLDKVLS